MNRRDFFSLSAGAAILPSKLSATEHIDECQANILNLLASLKAQHGGEWVAHSDEMNEFVLIRRVDINCRSQ